MGTTNDVDAASCPINCSTASCKTCRFASPDEDCYSCRRYAPKPKEAVEHTNEKIGWSGCDEFYMVKWPLMNPDDWCGEYQSRQ